MITAMGMESAPRPGLRERRRIATRRALTDAAFALFSEQGYEATTVDQIADAAEVSRASFFRYFAAKDDVLGSDDDERREAFIATFRSRGEQDPLDALRPSAPAAQEPSDSVVRAGAGAMD